MVCIFDCFFNNSPHLLSNPPFENSTLQKGWYWSDPLCSIFISVMTFIGTWPLLKSSGEILLQRTPRTLEPKMSRIYQDLMTIHGVHGVSKKHFWELNQNEYVGSIVLQVARGADEHDVIGSCQNMMRNHSINNCTVQIEKEFNFKI